MPFGATVAGDVFPVQAGPMFWSYTLCDCHNRCIMVVGRMQNHRDHDQALTTLLHTARTCNVILNYDKL